MYKVKNECLDGVFFYPNGKKVIFKRATQEQLKKLFEMKHPAILKDEVKMQKELKVSAK